MSLPFEIPDVIPFFAISPGLNTAIDAVVPIAELAIVEMPFDDKKLTMSGVAKSEIARMRLNEITVRKLISVLFISLKALLHRSAASVAHIIFHRQTSIRDR